MQKLTFVALAVASLLSTASTVALAHYSCTDIMIVTPAKNAKLVTLDASASKKVFTSASNAQIGVNFNLGGGPDIQSILQTNMACCRLAKQTNVIASTERCLISVSDDGSLTSLSVSFLK